MKPISPWDPRRDIKNLSRQELITWLEANGLRPFRASQILKWIYIRQVDAFQGMTDLRKELRGKLEQTFRIERLKLEARHTSRDGTIKFLFGLADGEKIESVLIPEKEHYTLCISSQVGCAQGCTFCMTGKGGLVRNLTRGEIIAQVRDVANMVSGTKRLTNLVFMGMGEPLANYEEVVAAIHTITSSDEGLRMAARRVTLSTAGMVPRMASLGRDTRVNLAISLNATDNHTRSKLMPINRIYPIQKLLAACRDYALPNNRKITFEYILIKGVNDSMDDARRLAKLLAPIRSKINLIPFNPHPASVLERPPEERILAFQELLCKKHYTVIIRRSKGEDISAACGQLRAGKINSAHPFLDGH
jgi:23S rRNA (adenine2503-C2)-methyltransferase